MLRITAADFMPANRRIPGLRNFDSSDESVIVVIDEVPGCRMK